MNLWQAFQNRFYSPLLGERERPKPRLPGAVLITACGCTRDYDGIPYNCQEWIMPLSYLTSFNTLDISTIISERRRFRYEGSDDRGVRIFREVEG